MSPRRTLVFIDVEGSTALVERLGDAAAAVLWAEHDRRARELLATHGGREVDRSDGFFLLFDSPRAAAGFALAYQAASAALGLKARIGLHVGEVTMRTNRAEDIARGAKPVEVEGLAKPIAARVMSLARGGQTLLSDDMRVAVGEGLPPDTTIAAHGHFRLKGIEEPMALFEMARTGHAMLPPADTDKAYCVVRDAAGEWCPRRAVRHNLPAERDVFVGRAGELRALAQELDAGTRLLTLLGPGGIGKTRLARRYARAWLGDWPGGVHFCDLSEARSAEGIVYAVGVALGVALDDDGPVRQLGHAMASRGRCLVILDNFEQVAEHAAATLGAWLDRCDEACFVVTSRERLQIAGEVVQSIEPLPLRDDAAALFAARARAQRSDFAITDDNREAVNELMRLLDGLPLAIELAAARVRLFSPAQLVAQMTQRFQLLASTRGAVARQATLETTIDWSWELLSGAERKALAQCSVFEGGFTPEAAAAVLDVPPSGAPSTLDVLQALVDKSLLRSAVPAQAAEAGQPRLGMSFSIQAYAARRLAEGGEEARPAAQRRHGAWFAAMGGEESLRRLWRHGGLAHRRRLELELDNLVGACRRAAARGDADTAVGSLRAAWEVLDFCGPFSLGLALAEAALAIEPLPAATRLKALATLGRARARAERTDEAADALEQALELARRLRESAVEAEVLGQLGRVRGRLGRLEAARSCLEAALRLHRESGDRVGEAADLGVLALVAARQGRIAEALVQFAQALAMHRDSGNRSLEGVVLCNLAGVYRVQGRLDDCRKYLQDALSAHRESRDRRAQSLVLGNLGALVLELRRPEEARALFEQSADIARDIGAREREATSLIALAHLDIEASRFEEAQHRFTQAHAMHHEAGDALGVGNSLHGMALAHFRQGRPVEALAVLREAEGFVRSVRHLPTLGELLCLRGEIEAAIGEGDAARRSLAEAQHIAISIEAGPGSALGRDVAALHARLG